MRANPKKEKQLLPKELFEFFKKRKNHKMVARDSNYDDRQALVHLFFTFQSLIIIFFEFHSHRH